MQHRYEWGEVLFDSWYNNSQKVKGLFLYKDDEVFFDLNRNNLGVIHPELYRSLLRLKGKRELLHSIHVQECILRYKPEDYFTEHGLSHDSIAAYLCILKGEAKAAMKQTINDAI